MKKKSVNLKAHFTENKYSERNEGREMEKSPYISVCAK